MEIKCHEGYIELDILRLDVTFSVNEDAVKKEIIHEKNKHQNDCNDFNYDNAPLNGIT